MTERLSYTPPVPDGPDRPWTRGRRTRWWLVVPADLVTVALTSVLVCAAVDRTPELVGVLLAGVVAVAVGWLCAWGAGRPQDHLEAADRDGWTVLGVTLVVWLLLRVLAGTPVGEPGLALACFLGVLGAGWRWLYGFAKAQESITPRAVQRRLDAQEAEEDRLRTEVGTSER